MSDPISRFARQAWERGSSAIAGLRRQAPGARMIGEMVVRQITKSVSRPSRSNSSTTSSATDEHTGATPPND